LSAGIGGAVQLGSTISAVAAPAWARRAAMGPDPCSGDRRRPGLLAVVILYTDQDARVKIPD